MVTTGSAAVGGMILKTAIDIIIIITIPTSLMTDAALTVVMTA
jgi:GrpB-like predicted nucleotidyltransferase (UPF0157 family)